MLFESERLTFRVWNKNDLEAGFALWGNSEVMKLIEPALDKDQVARSIQAGADHYDKYGLQHFAMVNKENKKIIGCCGLSVEDFDKSVYEFVIHILPEYQNLGYGKEAGLAVLKFSKDKNVKKIVAACHTENAGSKSLLSYLGFTYIEDLWYDDTKRYECYYEMDL